MRADALRRIALALPDAEERETWGDATFRVRDRIFVIMRTDGKRASIKSTHEEQLALIEGNPVAYYLPEYVAHHGWVGVNLPRARTDEVGELVTEAWRMTALKRTVKAFDEGRA